MKNILAKIPSVFRTFYFLSIMFFFIWLAFIDSNDLFMQADLSGKQSDLRQAKLFYEERILEVKNDKAALENNLHLLEKLAREKYLMKKENEDLYIVVKND